MTLVFATHHKCATTFLIRLIVQYCQKSGANIAIMEGANREVWRGGNPHFLALRNAEYRFTRQFPRFIHVVRNPLDLIVSAYHSHRTTHPEKDWPNLARHRALLQRIDRDAGLAATWVFCERADINEASAMVGPLHALRHWQWDNDGEITVRMEDLVREPWEILQKVSGDCFAPWFEPIVRATNFEAITGRKIGQIDETSHYRSGLSEGWKTEMPLDLARAIVASQSALCERFYPHLLAI